MPVAARVLLGFGEADSDGTRDAESIDKSARSLAANQTNFFKDVAWSASLSHPHILQFLGASTRRKPFMIVTELAVGSLQSLSELPVQPGLDRAAELALQAAHGLGYMHERKPSGLMHTDLLPGNFLLVGAGEAQDQEQLSEMLLKNGVLKIADFGACEPIGSPTIGAERVGAPTMAFIDEHAVGEDYALASTYTMSPEWYRGEQYNHKRDVYAFSFTMYQLFEGRIATAQTARMAALEGTRPAFRKTVGEKDKFHTPEPIRKLIADCWQDNPNKRPEVREIIARLRAFRDRLRGQEKKAAARSADAEKGIWVKGVQAGDLPGFTRSVVERDFALLTPESRVWTSVPGWQDSLVADVITPAPPMNAEFTMLLANMKRGGTSMGSPGGAERFVFVIAGKIQLTCKDSRDLLGASDFAYFPPNYEHTFKAPIGALLVVYERQYVPPPGGGSPAFVWGSTDRVPNVETPKGKNFKLKKLLPSMEHYDFNIHVMDFEPGESLDGKEYVNYNRHGLLMLEGQGVSRLGERWFSTRAGDAIWTAPSVPQWYGALGKRRTRHILYHGTRREPGTSGSVRD